MKLANFGNLLLALSLVACSHRPPPTATPAAVAPPAPSRPLLEAPPPAEVPVPPTPELKPGSDTTLTGEGATGTTVGPPHDKMIFATPAAGGTGQTAGTTASLSDTDPASLVGLSEADATRRFGPPASHADTPPSRVWTYHSSSCDLRLFFYPEVGGATYRTLTYEIDDHDPADTTRRGCISGLLKNHAG